MQAWRAMETAVQAGYAKQLGISNIKSMAQLERLWEAATVKPAVVQMRFHAKTNFEREMRAWCSEKGELIQPSLAIWDILAESISFNRAGVFFQSFWTLTANRKSGMVLRTEAFQQLAAKYQVPKEVSTGHGSKQRRLQPLRDETCLNKIARVHRPIFVWVATGTILSLCHGDRNLPSHGND